MKVIKRDKAPQTSSLDMMPEPAPLGAAVKIGAKTGAKLVNLATKYIDNLIGATNHHIFTKYGKWKPIFEKMFEKAGYKLDDAINLVQVMGHYGPHEEANQLVYDYMSQALSKAKNSAQYKEIFEREINNLAVEAQTEGSLLNTLLTSARKNR